MEFTAHPDIVERIFAVFSCTEIEDGEFYLNDDLDLECWNDEHTNFAFGVGIPGLILWVIGIPTVALLILTKLR